MGHVERRHRHIINTNIAMINQANLPPSMWDFGVIIAYYLYNKNSTPILQGHSPFEALFGKILEYTKLQVFGYWSYPCLRPYWTHKLDVKSRAYVFVGHSQ